MNLVPVFRVARRHLPFLGLVLFLTAGSAFRTSHGPKLAFTETVFNFGEVTPGDLVRHEFKFKNTGDEPLLIREAVGSCGCIVTDWPKDPILPHKTAAVVVTFNSTGKAGMTEKSVSVYSNDLDNPQIVLKLTGTVKPRFVAPAPVADTAHH